MKFSKDKLDEDPDSLIVKMDRFKHIVTKDLLVVSDLNEIRLEICNSSKFNFHFAVSLFVIKNY